MNNSKLPEFVLFDDIHVEVHISRKMTVQDRSKLRKSLNSKTLNRGLTNMVLITGPVPPTDKPQIRVKITR